MKLSTVTFRVVPNSYRELKPRRPVGRPMTPLMKALVKDGRTVLIEGVSHNDISRLRQQVKKSHNARLHARTYGNGLVVWAESIAA